MPSGHGSSCCSRTGHRSVVAGGVTTGRQSTRSPSSSGPGFSGFTCRRGAATVKGLQPVANVCRGHLGAGLHCADGSGRRRRGPRLGRLGGLDDRARSPVFGRGPQKKGPGRRTRRPRHRPIPRRTDHEDPPRRRRPLRPLAFVLTAGQAGDAPVPTAVIRRLRVPRQQGRPRTRPDIILANKAYFPARSAITCANAASRR
jgi:hypothetical protein